MIGKKLFSIVFLGVLGTLIIIGAVKFLPIQKAFQNNHSAQKHSIEGSVKTIEDVNQLKKALKNTNPIVIKFYANWCGACNYIKEPFAEISNDLSDITFYEINVDNQEIMNYVDEHKISKDGIEALPTFVLRKGEKINEQIVGGMSKDKLTHKIKNVFS